MPRHLKIGLIVLGVGFALTFGFFVDFLGRIRAMVDEVETEENPFVQPAAPLFEPTDPPITVKIFFPANGGDIILTAEDTHIFQSAELINQARQILQKLEEGPKSKTMLPALPEGTHVEELFISESGTAFVDFTNTLSTNHPGGILNEQATIYAIVNTLTYNLPEIREVKILVGGTEKETLAGHCLLLLPFQMDLGITDVEPPPESQTTQVNASSQALQ